MKITGDKKNFGFLLNSMNDNVIEELDLDLSSKPNVFAAGFASKANDVKIPDITQVPTATVSNPLRRLNAYDNEYLYSNEIKKIESNSSKDNQNNTNNGGVIILRGVYNVVKHLICSFPLVNYFMLKDKQKRLKSTLTELSSINTDIDSLVAQASPYGEQAQKYKIICDNLVKANNLHTQIKKEMNE